MPPKRKAQADPETAASDTEETEVLAKKPAESRIIVPTPERQTDEEGNAYFEISGKRRVTIRAYNGLKLVDIREMYTDRATGELKPGKKGISLAEEQFMALVNSQAGITEALNQLDTGASGSAAKKTKITKTKTTTKKKPRKVDEEDEE